MSAEIIQLRTPMRRFESACATLELKLNTAAALAEKAADLESEAAEDGEAIERAFPELWAARCAAPIGKTEVAAVRADIEDLKAEFIEPIVDDFLISKARHP